MERKSKKFVSADDLEWREINRRLGACSRKSDWQGVIRAYRDMIEVYKRNGQDYSEISQSIEKIQQKAKEDARFNNISCLVVLIIFGLIVYFLFWKPIECFVKACNPSSKSTSSHRR